MTFLDMGGYWAYVWPSYGVTTLALVVLVIQTLSERHRTLARLEVMRAARRDRGDS